MSAKLTAKQRKTLRSYAACESSDLYRSMTTEEAELVGRGLLLARKGGAGANINLSITDAGRTALAGGK